MEEGWGEGSTSLGLGIQENKLDIQLFFVLIFIMIFFNICEILLCIVGFSVILFFIQYTHCIIIFLYSSINLFNARNLYLVVQFAHFVEGDKI